MPAAATANRNAALTVEGIKFEVLAAEAAGRQLKLDEVREIPLIHVPGDLALAAGHAHRSSDRRRGGLLVRDSLRHARPSQKPLKYDTWSRPTAHWGGRPFSVARLYAAPKLKQFYLSFLNSAPSASISCAVYLRCSGWPSSH